MASAVQRRLLDIQPEVTPTAIPAPELVSGPGEALAAASPWRQLARRLRRDPLAWLGGLLVAAVVAGALLAPVYAAQVAKTTPERGKIDEQIVVDGKPTDIVSVDGIPMGPTWQSQYLLGADLNGRDLAVRLLYASRNSLIVGLAATLLTLALSLIAGLLAGYYRGPVDWLISRAMDVMWAIPVLLLGVALGVSLTLGGVSIGPIELQAGSLWIPSLIIGVVGIVYLARPLRGEVLRLREQEFVEAARAQGAGGVEIMVRELLPNLVGTVIVFFPIIFANAVLLEASLSFLGAGVQAPETSWGALIGDGVKVLITQPTLTIAPGVLLVMALLGLNLIGEAVRQALDPRAALRLDR